MLGDGQKEEALIETSESLHRRMLRMIMRPIISFDLSSHSHCNIDIHIENDYRFYIDQVKQW